MIFFNFFNFFAISLEFSITRRVGTDRNGTTIFIFSLSQPFPTNFGWKLIHMGIYNFYEFCCYFFLEFSIMGRVGRNGSEQYVSLSLFLGLLQRTLD